MHGHRADPEGGPLHRSCGFVGKDRRVDGRAGERAITLVASPASFLRAIELGWKLFRRGQHIAVTTMSATALRIRVTWPPLVTPMLIARCVGTSFRAAAEATGAVNVQKADLTELDRTTAVYDISCGEAEAARRSASSRVETPSARHALHAGRRSPDLEGGDRRGRIKGRGPVAVGTGRTRRRRTSRPSSRS